MLWFFAEKPDILLYKRWYNSMANKLIGNQSKLKERQICPLKLQGKAL